MDGFDVYNPFRPTEKEQIMSIERAMGVLLAPGKWMQLPLELTFIATLHEVFVFSYLLGKARQYDGDQNGEWFYCTMSKMEKDIGMSRSARQRTLNKLKKRGWLKIEHRGMPAKRFFKLNYMKVAKEISIQGEERKEEEKKKAEADESQHQGCPESNKADYPKTGNSCNPKTGTMGCPESGSKGRYKNSRCNNRNGAKKIGPCVPTGFFDDNTSSNGNGHSNGKKKRKIPNGLTDFDLKQGGELKGLMVEHNTDLQNTRVETFAKTIQDLRTKRKKKELQIERVLSLYKEIYGNEYTPKMYKAIDFARNFSRIEDAIERLTGEDCKEEDTTVSDEQWVFGRYLRLSPNKDQDCHKEESQWDQELLAKVRQELAERNGNWA